REDILADPSEGFRDDGSVQANLMNPLMAEFSRRDAQEQLIADTVAQDIAKGDTGILEDFKALYQAADAPTRKKLAGLKQKLNDVVRFEIMQNGHTELQPYLIE
ncbi:MAG TPA: hypothetical protein PKO06_23105, partial [Candidatus Ozemobacteraceae bacterium]|nr:hypothetical protein [Candidatus Ozemobacteraceae bacterium]